MTQVPGVDLMALVLCEFPWLLGIIDVSEGFLPGVPESNQTCFPQCGPPNNVNLMEVFHQTRDLFLWGWVKTYY